MTPKPTKEQLAQENLRLITRAMELEQQDQTLREELSKALHSPGVPYHFEQMGYSPNVYREKQAVYSWYEIIREVGKLLATDQRAYLQAEVEKLRETNLRLGDRLDELSSPKP